jgi:hypothetical protein
MRNTDGYGVPAIENFHVTPQGWVIDFKAHQFKNTLLYAND